MHKQSEPRDPRDVFKQKLLRDGALNQSHLASALGMSKPRVSMILSGRCPINAEVALRVERAFGIPAQFWMTLCNEYELHREERRLRDQLAALSRRPKSSEPYHHQSVHPRYVGLRRILRAFGK
jgi:addiction module HigA family antidote